MTKGIVRVDGFREHGLGWQRKHKELKYKMIEREERLTLTLTLNLTLNLTLTLNPHLNLKP